MEGDPYNTGSSVEHRLNGQRIMDDIRASEEFRWFVAQAALAVSGKTSPEPVSQANQ